VEDVVVLFVLAGEIDADGDMAALDLVIDRLAEIVQQSGALGLHRVEAQFGGHRAGQQRHLDRVL
jgi:hypothetical protein